MISGLSLNAMDIDTAYITQKINNKSITNGLNIIVAMNDMRNLKIDFDYTPFQCIFVVNTHEMHQSLLSKYEKSQHLVLFKAASIFEQYQYALKFTTKSHVLFMHNRDQFQINGEIDELTTGITYIPNYKDLRENSFMLNQMFNDSNSNEDIFMDDVIDQVSVNIPSEVHVDSTKLAHPNLIEIASIEPEVTVESAPKEKVVYPSSILFDKLFHFNGILFDRDCMSIAFDKTDNFRQVLLKYMTFTDGIMKIETINYETHEELISETNDQPFEMLRFIDNLMCYRNNEEVKKILQYQADQYLYQLGNAIDHNDMDKGTVNNQIKLLNLTHIQLNALNKGHADTLVIAYCFPPYNDTSGNVMAKRIQETGDVVDVITNNMDKIRKKDASLNKIANEFIDSQFILNAPQAFSSYESIDQFVSEGIQVFRAFKDKYKKLYSRAMFPASHFLAFEIKMEKPTIEWTAEFSDPLHTDVNSQIRYAPIKDPSYIQRIKQLLPESYKILADDNVFNLCELLPLAYAEKLLFTNEHQLAYMISRFDETIQKSIKERAIIKQHPTLPKSFYNLERSFYEISLNKINLAYFGNFYDTRGFREIELLCKYLSINNANDFVIHVFTNVNSKVLSMYENSTFKSYIRINPYVDYFEFLNLSNKMDGLLIFDAHTIGIKSVNPYLPSKLSDYLGAKAITIAFTEENSILSKQNHPNLLKVNMNHFSEYINIYRQLKNKLKK